MKPFVAVVTLSWFLVTFAAASIAAAWSEDQLNLTPDYTRLVLEALQKKNDKNNLQ